MATRTRLAKLTRPATAATYSRTRLFEELDKADAAPVVWVVGPPGSGKTTLIADYTTTRAPAEPLVPHDAPSLGRMAGR